MHAGTKVAYSANLQYSELLDRSTFTTVLGKVKFTAVDKYGKFVRIVVTSRNIPNVPTGSTMDIPFGSPYLATR